MENILGIEKRMPLAEVLENWTRIDGVAGLSKKRAGRKTGQHLQKQGDGLVKDPLN